MAELAAPHPHPLAEPHPPPEEVARFGMWVFLATELMFFGVLFGAYLVTRIEYAEGFAEASRHTSVSLGTLNTALLLTSSVTMALAVRAAKLDSKRETVDYLLLTIGFGLEFLAIKLIEYAYDYTEQLVPGVNFDYPGSHAQAAELFFYLYFVMTGLHALHLVIGIVMVAVISWLVWSGRLAGRVTPVELTGLYWHLIDVIWIFLYLLLYLLART